MPTTEERKLPEIDSALDNHHPSSAKPMVGKGRGLLTKANTQNLVMGVAIAVTVMVGALIVISKKNVAKKKSANPRHPQVDIGSGRPKPTPLIAAPADKRPIDKGTTGSDAVTPQAVQMTVNPATEQARRSQELQERNAALANPGPSGSQSSATQQPSAAQQSRAVAATQPYRPYSAYQAEPGKPLGKIAPFNGTQSNGNGAWQPTPYNGQTLPNPSAIPAMSQEAKRAYSDEVTKQSVTFTLTETSLQKPGPGLVAPITNLGLMEGYHIGARTETAASSAQPGAPVIADIQYNYMRDGKVLIPAGTRAVGKMSNADSSGNTGFTFTALEFPDGSRVPITAIALDRNMMPIKGYVTGKNLAKQFLIATMAGLGEATAMVAGGSNMSGAYSQSDMIKQQAAMNIGNAADSQIELLNNGQHLVVTVPAGTEINVVFVKPTASGKPAGI